MLNRLLPLQLVLSATALQPSIYTPIVQSTRRAYTPLRAPPQSPILSLRGGGSNSLLRGGKQAWDRYLLALERQPLRTKTATSAALAALGDIIAQCLEAGSLLSAATFAPYRLLNLVVVNVLFITPLLCATYALNEWLVGAKCGFPATSAAGTTCRLAFDQLVCAPFVVFSFFCSFGLVSAVSAAVFASEPFLAATLLTSIAHKLRTEYIGTMISNWKIWVLPQALNFRLMPEPLRVPFASLVALGWNVVLALVANR